jgi:hypothetical protein
MLPEDPIMLMSMINMKLRDTGKNFEELCEDLDVSAGDVEKKLSNAGFEYNKDCKSIQMTYINR